MPKERYFMPKPLPDHLCWHRRGLAFIERAKFIYLTNSRPPDGSIDYYVETLKQTRVSMIISVLESHEYHFFAFPT